MTGSLVARPRTCLGSSASWPRVNSLSASVASTSSSVREGRGEGCRSQHHGVSPTMDFLRLMAQVSPIASISDSLVRRTWAEHREEKSESSAVSGNQLQ